MQYPGFVLPVSIVGAPKVSVLVMNSVLPAWLQGENARGLPFLERVLAQARRRVAFMSAETVRTARDRDPQDGDLDLHAPRPPQLSLLLGVVLGVLCPFSYIVT